MTAQDFSSANTGRTYAQLFGQATGKRKQQDEAGAEEKAARAAELRTQGRKGCRAVRINLAFTPENHAFIKLMAKATGRTMTEFTNLVIAAYRQEHPEFTEQANEFLKFVNSGQFSKFPTDQQSPKGIPAELETAEQPGDISRRIIEQVKASQALTSGTEAAKESIKGHAGAFEFELVNGRFKVSRKDAPENDAVSAAVNEILNTVYEKTNQRG